VGQISVSYAILLYTGHNLLSASLIIAYNYSFYSVLHISFSHQFFM